MLYFLSLYYRTTIPSGANKRFEELGRALAGQLPGEFGVIVPEGEVPDLGAPIEAVEVPVEGGALGRLKTARALSRALRALPGADIVSDFMPIPFSALAGHRHYQLIHDLRRFTSFSPGRLGSLGAAFQRSQLRRSRGIVTVSEASREDIVARCDVPPDRIVVSYNGVSPGYLSQDHGVERDIDVLYIAAFEARKNHRTLIEGLKRSAWPVRVCLVGRDHGELDFVKGQVDELAAENGSVVTFVQDASESELLSLYNRARVFASPSLLEGFGMPLIEAMGMGCRLAVSDIPVFREICLDNACYFEPENPDDLWRGIEQAMDGPLPDSGALDRFTWSAIAERLRQDLRIESTRANA